MADARVVKAVIIRVGGKDVTLPIAEAKKLHEALGELFPESQWVVPYEPRPWVVPYHPRPYIWWYYTADTGDNYTLRMCDEPQATETIG